MSYKPYVVYTVTVEYSWTRNGRESVLESGLTMKWPFNVMRGKGRRVLAANAVPGADARERQFRAPAISTLLRLYLLPSAPPPLRPTSSDVRGSSAQRHVPHLAARRPAFASLRPSTASALRIHSAILNIPFCPPCAVHFPHLSITPGSLKAVNDQTQEQANST